MTSLMHSYGRPPFGVVDLSQTTFASDQMYDVSLELLVPTSRRNMDIGEREGGSENHRLRHLRAMRERLT